MNIETLLNRYQSSSLVPSKESHDHFEYFFLGDQYLKISKDELSENETFLLRALYQDEQRSLWYEYLIKDVPLMNRSLHRYTIIQFKLNHNLELKDLWLSTFLDFLEGFEDAFFISEKQGIVIVKHELTEDLDFVSILETMEQDIMIRASIYIGKSATLGEGMLNQFKEDMVIYSRIKNNAPVENFNSLYLKYYFSEQIANSYTLFTLRDKILNFQDSESLIAALWKNGANVTQTSKDLYLHRNTLNYRLDKFEEEIGLSLRNLEDLLLSYLCIQ